jgi:aryl-alcohol dehydrogenase-like predicted oxidoreductase
MNKNNKLTRKEFIEKSSKAVLGFGIVGLGANKYSPAGGNESDGKTTLGRTKIRVFPLGFGASRTMEPALVQAAIDGGMNFLDTGRSYSRGQNEIMVGKVIAGMRDKVVIQSKLRVRFREEGERSSQEIVKETLDNMSSSLEASLKALGTDYIDIMLIHGASSVEDAYHEAVLEFFTSIKKKGIIRAHGFSSHTNQVELLRAANRNPFYDVIMIPYNHKGSYIHSNSGSYSEWDQPALEIEMEKAKKHDIGLIAMKTCSGGPYASDDTEPPSFDQALAWVLKQDKVHAMAVAMGNFAQIEENLKALR